MEALFPLSSAVPRTDYPFSLNFQMLPNFNSTCLKSTPSSRNITLIKAFPTPFQNSSNNPHNFPSLLPKLHPNSPSAARINATAPSSKASAVAADHCTHWMVIVERPPDKVLQSKEETVNYCVGFLQRVWVSEKDPKSCIYDVSCDKQFGFCCDIDEVTSRALAGLPEVLQVRPDPSRNSGDKDYSASEALPESSRQPFDGAPLLFPAGSSRHWLVRMGRPGVGVVSKAQMVDLCVQTLTKVLGNEKDAQMCIYHVSWQSNFGFCCELDEESATELAGVPGVISVQPDRSVGSENKDYRGDGLMQSTKSLDPSDAKDAMQINPKKLFVTGLSFYTSEKTLRAAFEPFGELVEVKVIMDQISKRSKGYAFLEYTTEESASAALQEMNGKIINGWMIVVDRAKNKPRYSRAQPRPRA